MQEDNKLSRRQFLKILAVAGGAGVVAKLGFDAISRLEKVSETRLLMGTIVNLTVIAPSQTQAQTALDGTFAEMQRLIATFDHRQVDSPVAVLNSTGKLIDASAEMLAVTAEALHVAEMTQGAFDITVKPLLDAYQAGRAPTQKEMDRVDYRGVLIKGKTIEVAQPGMEITFDGIAKGYIVDQGVAVLAEHGFHDVIVEAGGDLRVAGAGENGDAWRIGINDPRPTQEQMLETIAMAPGAVATSGDYIHVFTTDKSLHHIIDPHLGASPPELASVSVIACSAMLADALSTALMVMGPEAGIELVETLPTVEAMTVSKEKHTTRSSGFPTSA
ncbi:MAG: FAD:protein FMN transferase [Chloroflexi bacterium]|nr:MAG: FAD:protein FMN transferase [Chloroflexota bacterium]MBL1194871.1 FAD:protein FMN transferase [Chloroflexota bacterium]NOH12162.1 FAD:protein FMN transferase [Chloroflexota bacterium]